MEKCQVIKTNDADCFKNNNNLNPQNYPNYFQQQNCNKSKLIDTFITKKCLKKKSGNVLQKNDDTKKIIGEKIEILQKKSITLKPHISLKNPVKDNPEILQKKSIIEKKEISFDFKTSQHPSFFIELEKAIKLSKKVNDISLTSLLVKALNSNNIDVTDHNSYTPLMLSVKKGYYKLVELLLNLGANPNIKGIYDQTSLHFASNGFKPSIVKLLLNYNCNPNSKNDKGLTPLMLCIIGNENLSIKLSIIKILIDNGADVNAFDIIKRSTLKYAMDEYQQNSGTKEILSTLLDAGATDKNFKCFLSKI